MALYESSSRRNFSSIQNPKLKKQKINHFACDDVFENAHQDLVEVTQSSFFVGYDERAIKTFPDYHNFRLNKNKSFYPMNKKENLDDSFQSSNECEKNEKCDKNLELHHEEEKISEFGDSLEITQQNEKEFINNNNGNLLTHSSMEVILRRVQPHCHNANINNALITQISNATPEKCHLEKCLQITYPTNGKINNCTTFEASKRINDVSVSCGNESSEGLFQPSPKQSFHPQHCQPFPDLQQDANDVGSIVTMGDFYLDSAYSEKHIINLFTEINQLKENLIEIYNNFSTQDLNLTFETEKMVSLFKKFIEIQSCFFSCNKFYRNIEREDKSKLLRRATAVSVFITSSGLMDTDNFTWPNDQSKSMFAPYCIRSSTRPFRSLLTNEQYIGFISFCTKYNKIYSDDVMLILTQVLTLFKDSSNLKNREIVKHGWNHYMTVLRSYVHFAYGREQIKPTINLVLQSIHDAFCLSSSTRNVGVDLSIKYIKTESDTNWNNSLTIVKESAFHTIIKAVQNQLSNVTPDSGQQTRCLALQSTSENKIYSTDSQNRPTLSFSFKRPSEKHDNDVIGTQKLPKVNLTEDEIRDIKSILKKLKSCKSSAVVAFAEKTIPLGILNKCFLKL